MKGTMHHRCRNCGRNEPAQVNRIRKTDGWVIDKLVCLGCGKRWRNSFLEPEKAQAS